MSDQYLQDVAEHYAAYRPSLHGLILSRALNAAEGLSTGLDVGCGTGRSSVALADYCHTVIGIDPSESMLRAAEPHKRITYRSGCGESIPVPDQSIDLISFAGSLSYADVAMTVEELIRVGSAGALVVVYDFEVLIDEVLQSIGYAMPDRIGEYDHQANLSGIDALTELLVETERVDLDLDPAKLAHVLLADAQRHESLARRYNSPCPHRELTNDLGGEGKSIVIQSDIYYSTYRVGHER